MMDRIQQWRVFVAVAETSGFAAAARALGISPAASTRAVSALEGQLGVALFRRTTRVVRLTEAGRTFLPECQRLLMAITEAEASVAGAQVEPAGELGVTAPLTFGRRFIAPLVFDYLAEHSRARSRTLFTDRLVDLVDEGFDVAVRIGHLPDSSLIATRVGTMRQVVCGAPAYLDARGRPRYLRSLARHEVIGFSVTKRLHQWHDLGAPAPRLRVSEVDVGIAAAVAGRGLVRVLAYQVADELEDGRLEVVLRRFEPEPLPVHVVYPAERRVPAKVRVFLDLVVPALREALR